MELGSKQNLKKIANTQMKFSKWATKVESNLQFQKVIQSCSGLKDRSSFTGSKVTGLNEEPGLSKSVCQLLGLLTDWLNMDGT